VHPTYSLRNGLYFKDNGGSPKTFELKLDPTDVLDLGLYRYGVIIEMENYPKSQWPLVTREEKPFTVKINPCLVTSYAIGSYFSKVEYIIGNPQKAVVYNFAQAPCGYAATYSMKQKSGSANPTFINVLDRYEIFDIYSVDEDHVGNYTLTLTAVLDNVVEYNRLDPTMDDYISNVNDPANTYGPGGLIYTASFDFDLEVKPPESDYEEPDNTPPYLLPPPQDFFVEVGEYY
jgi:hypothetical protein